MSQQNDNFALWPSRDNYLRFRQIMDDRDRFPATFDEWERNAKRQAAKLRAELGVTIETVPFDPERFLAFCRREGLSPGLEARGLYGVEVGTAKRFALTAPTTG